MIENLIGLEKGFNFDAQAQQQVQNFDFQAAQQNIGAISGDKNMRNAAEASQLLNQQLVNFDQNAQDQTRFILGNNNFSTNKLRGQNALLQDDIRSDRALLQSELDKALGVVQDREDKDTAAELRKYASDQQLFAEARALGITDDLDDPDKLAVNIAKRNRELADDGFDYNPITGELLFNGQSLAGGNSGFVSGDTGSIADYFTGSSGSAPDLGADEFLGSDGIVYTRDENPKQDEDVNTVPLATTNRTSASELEEKLRGFGLTEDFSTIDSGAYSSMLSDLRKAQQQEGITPYSDSQIASLVFNL